MPGFTEGVYDHTIKRSTYKPDLNIYDHDHQMFLLDFYPFDEYRLFRRFQNQSDSSGDSKTPYSDSEDEDPETDPNPSQFRVRVFGLIEDPNDPSTRYSASLDLLNYKPFFYVKIPDHWTDYELTDFIQKLKHEADIDPKKWRPYEDLLLDPPHSKIVKAKPFYNFTGDEQFQYAQLVFVSNNGMKSFERLLTTLQKREPNFWKKHELMESNIEPMLRMMHIKDITMSGWVTIPKQKPKYPKHETSECQVHYEIDFNDIVPENERTDIPPLVTASYDIEADSSHGDFPIACKNYQKLAQDIVTEYLKRPEVKSKNQSKHTQYLRSLIYRWVMLAFEEYFDNNNINRIPTLNQEKPDEDTLDYLTELVLDLGERYHLHLVDIINKKLDDPHLRQQILDNYAKRLLIHLESNLPEIDLNPPKPCVGNYSLLAEQLLREYMRLTSSHSKVFLKNPKANIKFLLKLAFDDYYDNHTLNKVYCKRNIKPDHQTLINLIPQVHQICQECYEELNQPPKPKKQSSADPCKPKKSLNEPPPENQTKLSSTLKKTTTLPPRRTALRDRLRKQLNQDSLTTQSNIKKEAIAKKKKSTEIVSHTTTEESLQILKHRHERRTENRALQEEHISHLPTTKSSKFKHTISAKEYQQQKDDKAKPKSNKPSWKQNELDPEELLRNQKGRYIKPRPLKEVEDDDDDDQDNHDNQNEEHEDELAKIGRDFFVEWLHELFDQNLPDVEGDPVIQIGTTFKRYGEKELFLKHIITLKGASTFTNNQLISDENMDIYIENPKDAIIEAKKLNIESNLFEIIEKEEKRQKLLGIKKPKIPEMEDLNKLLFEARRDHQLKHDNATLRVECYNTEREVLLAWQRLIKETDPDILTGYNIFGFDFRFMYDRAQVLGVEEEFTDLSRIKLFPENLVTKKLVSSGLGDNLLYYLPMTGRVVVDLLKVVQSGGYRLPIYKLDFVCNHFLNKRKNDLPPQELFVLQKGSDQDRAKIARYCLIDCILCNRLIDRLEIITNNIGMSRVCSIPLTYLFLRGQGIKIFSFIAKICRNEGYLIKTKDRNDAKDKEGYEGACVLDPVKKIYFEPSAVADFNSLYPSCMIAWNLSHDSYIPPYSKYYNKLPKDQYYDVEYDTFKEEQLPNRKTKIKVKSGVRVCRFYQPPDGSKSLVPRVLDRLLKARKQTRKEQKKFPKGSFEWNVKEGLQLAYKVTANSLYGQCGAPTSSIFMKDIAASTTACGRGLIHKSKKFYEENYEGCTTIYGDSVTGDTPILLRDPHTREIEIKTIETMAETEWTSYLNFKKSDPSLTGKQKSTTHYQVWTDQGWAEIKKVIRHKTNKRLYRVQSYQGSVDVTEDHSLYTEDGEKIQPDDCQPIQFITETGEREEMNDISDASTLLSAFPKDFPSKITMVPEVGQKEEIHEGESFKCNKCSEMRSHLEYYYTKYKGVSKRAKICKICVKRRQCELKGIPFNGTLDRKILQIHTVEYPLTPEEAWVWGFFMADGSCGKYGEKEKTKHSWAINNQNKDYLNQAIKYLHQVEPELVRFKILETMKSSHVYKLVPTGSIKYMVDKYRPLFYDKDDYKIVPKIVLNAELDVRKSFFEGYYAGDGSKTHGYGLEIDRIKFDNKGKIGSMGLYYLAKSIGYNDIVVNIKLDKPDTYGIYTNESLRKNYRNKLRRIIELPNPEEGTYVYDLETSAGKFHAGVGSVIVSNTDSVFVKFPSTNIRGEPLYGLDAIYKNIELCTEGALGISLTLPKPHNLEFEKAIWPFMLLSKKRYHGHYYTVWGKPNFYANSMGIVLKRRDNAQIVKHIFGGVIDIIMKEHDMEKAVKFCQDESKKLLQGKFPIDMFTITKTLKSYYKNPDQIAHNVLAQRIGERDPGNKPQSNDRMAFAYVKVPEPAHKDEKILQGDRIETPEYIENHKLPLDYKFYLTNQVMKPVTQIFELEMDEKELGDLFIDALIEYDRQMSGAQRLTKFLTKREQDQEDYVKQRRFLDETFEKILKEIKDEDLNDKPITYKDGDEVLFD